MDVEQTIREYLPPIVHMSLATVSDNKPWVCEVHFAYDENLNLYFRSLASRRHSQEIAANSNVSGTIVRQFRLEEAPVGIYFEGTAIRLDAGTEQNKACDVIMARLNAGSGILEEAQQPDGHQFYKVSVDTYYMFGKFGDAASKKYELQWNGGVK